jgi:hypothetical protein
VGEAMTRDVVTIDPDAAEAVELMQRLRSWDCAGSIRAAPR